VKWDKRREGRVRSYSIVMGVIFLVLAAQLVNLQIFNTDYYAMQAQMNTVRKLPIKAHRGDVYSRHGTLLVSNRPAFTVSLLPMSNADTAGSLQRLSELVGVPVGDFREAMLKQGIEEYNGVFRGRLWEPVPLLEDITPEVFTLIEEHKDELPGIVVEVQPVRDYIYGSLAGHLLGYLSYIGDTDPAAQIAELTEASGKPYSLTDKVGLTGLEEQYEAYLKGIDGRRIVEVDAAGRLIDVIGLEEPLAGDSLVLTIDAELQKAAEVALANQIKWIQTRPEVGYQKPIPEADAGAVVVLDVNSGEVLAMASYPTLEPSHPEYALAGVNPETGEPNDQKNYAVAPGSRGYPPGSTFKVLTAIAALESEVTHPDERFYDPGYFQLGTGPGSRRYCWRYTSPTHHQAHGYVDIIQAIKQSCNTVFYDLGVRLGYERLRFWADAFGLGQKTGIDLPTEHAGTPVEPPLPGEGGRLMSMGIGQEQGYTAIQIANFAAAVANGGTLYRPRLVKRIISAEGETLEEFEPEIISQIDVSEEALAIAGRGMLEVTSPRGTAFREGITSRQWEGTAYWYFRDLPFQVAGKTGTADDYREGWPAHGWFMAFAPYDDPEIAVAVFIKHGDSSSEATAVARKVIDAYFHEEIQAAKEGSSR